MSQKVRVRFAPSPTGALHIGGVRTALFNYLFAKKHRGDFLLRIEDTDQTRYVEGAEKYIIDSLNWCGIIYNEGIDKEGDCGPYRQSERKELYREYAQKLIDSGWAYYAFDTAESLDEHRKDHEAKGKTFIYNWHNREKLTNSLSLSAEEVQQKLDAGEPYVVRFKMPADETLVMQDLIRGEVSIETKTLDDKVLFKSDGMPTYHLANIVDDHLMRISHVIRGEEWLPSLPLHLLLYRAFGWEAPEFAHLPLILKPVGNGKLSKRDGQKLGFPVFPLQWKEDETILNGYREDGYFPEALVNFLALLGWNSGDDKEIFSMEELVEAFDLDRVHKAGARFDPEKIKWFNHHYLQEKSDAELADGFAEILREKGVDTSDIQLTSVVASLKERATFISDFWELGSFFFEAPTSYDAKALKKQWKEGTADILNDVKNILESSGDFSSEKLEASVKEYISENELGFGQVMPPLRLALVGEMKGPHIFDIMEILGKDETISRVSHFITSNS